MRVSVVICTWNRAALLDQTLARMHDLHIPAGVEWELLVVNNRCTDDTDSVISRHGAGLPLRRLHEPVPGKSHAANRAAAACQGELILWTDDDVLVDADWLAEYARAAGEWPEASYFGGTIDPWFACEPPAWLKTHFGRLAHVFAVRQLGGETRRLGAGEQVWGANIAFRAEVFRRHTFDTALGPVENARVIGEEVRLIEDLHREGHFGVWVGSARVAHYVPAERLTREYVWRYLVGLGRTLVRKDGVKGGKRWGGVPRWLLREYCACRVRAWCLRALGRTDWVNDFVRAGMAAGTIAECRDLARRGAPAVSVAEAAL